MLWSDGAIHFVTVRDNQFHIRQWLVPFDAKRYRTFRVRLRIVPNTVDEPIIGNLAAVDFESQVASAPIAADGEWHEQATDLSACADWRGQVNELWFEAANISAADVDIDWIPPSFG